VTSPYGQLKLGQHWCVMGKPGTGKTTLVQKLVRPARRLVVFDPKGDWSRYPGALTTLPGELRNRELLEPRFLRLVVLAGRSDDFTVAEEFTYAQRRLREGSRAYGGVVLVLEELNRYQQGAVEGLSNLHANGHGDGLVTVMVAQRAAWIPRGCRATASDVLSLLQDDEDDLQELEKDYGADFAERARSWQPHSPPAEWHQAPLWGSVSRGA
jgi:hypothetical protein